jgi:hypothetical protein
MIIFCRCGRFLGFGRTKNFRQTIEKKCVKCITQEVGRSEKVRQVLNKNKKANSQESA